MPSMSGCPQTFFGGVHADPIVPVFCARSGAQSGRPTAVTSAAAAHTRCNRFRSILYPIDCRFLVSLLIGEARIKDRQSWINTNHQSRILQSKMLYEAARGPNLSTGIT